MAGTALPTRNGVGAKDGSTTGSPNQTLYCTNLNDRLAKPDLRRELYMLFSSYGPVLDVVALKTSKMRGQAHVVFRDIQTSTQAMRALQGYEFLGKEMKIVYAKGTSNIIPKLRGTFEIPSTESKVETTELQRSIFNAPPSSMPSKPSAVNESITPAAAASPGPQGTKRPREEESDEEEAPMEEDDESDAPMDASSDED